MNLVLVALGAIVCTPALHARLSLAERPDRQAVLAFSATVLAALVAASVVGPLLVDAAAVSAPTARIAAGLVIAITSIADLWRPPFTGGDGGRRSAVCPAAFPELLAPPLIALTVSATMDRGLVVGLALSSVVAAAAATVLAWPGPREVTRLERGLLSLRAAGAIAVGLAVTMNGIYDI